MFRNRRFKAFVRDIATQTPLIRIILVFALLWLAFCAGLYWAERSVEGSTITSYGRALYWGIAAFSTAGIADTPVSGAGQAIGGIWIILGSILFFGAIVATVTAWFMQPFQRPARRIVETIEYNLERMDDLSIEELDLLKQTTDTLIEHMEAVKAARAERS